MLNPACSQLRRAPVHGSLHQFLKKMNICSWSESMAFICLGLSSSSKRHSFRITVFSLTLPIPDQLCLKLRWICLFHPSWTISSWVYSSWICCKWSRMLLTLWLGLGVMSHQSSNTLLTKCKTLWSPIKAPGSGTWQHCDLLCSHISAWPLVINVCFYLWKRDPVM